MTPRVLLPSLAALLALGAAAPLPARAQDALSADAAEAAGAEIAGRWAFVTDIYGTDCEMEGDLDLRPTEDPQVFEGALTARETCEGWTFEARQTAVVRRDGDALTIDSTLLSVTPWPAFPITYVPDNFVLTIVDAARMDGELRSAHQAPATFRRIGALVS